jgi:hypothetical protein
MTRSSQSKFSYRFYRCDFKLDDVMDKRYQLDFSHTGHVRGKFKKKDRVFLVGGDVVILTISSRQFVER